MYRSIKVAVVLGLFMANGACAAEQEKVGEAEKIPAPKVKAETPIYEMPYVPRSDTRDVWQHYGVNTFGRFVPRVIVTPYGPYYSRDLQPYPWAESRPSAILPRKLN
jgi:hypothetical protein